MSLDKTQNFRKSNELSKAGSKTSSENEILNDHDENDELSSARKFVKHLSTEGPKCPLDERFDNIRTKEDLPSFYDETMFRKGQDFYHKNIMGVFIGSYLALIVGFTQQPFGKILTMTNKSSTPVTAYKRYAGTIMHMCTWYESDFERDSKMWSSIRKVRKMHNSASKQSQSRLDLSFTQYDMTLVILIFMGFPLMRSEMVGIYDASEDELKCFTHFWRVMGYLMGIENEFNICKDSVEETRGICTLLLQENLIPKMQDGGVHFDTLSKAFLGGMQALLPVLLRYDHTIEYLHMVFDSFSDDDSFKKVGPLGSKSKLNVFTCLAYIMKYKLGRVVSNNLMYALLWLMRVFPIFAFFKFGMKNARVRI